MAAQCQVNVVLITEPVGDEVIERVREPFIGGKTAGDQARRGLVRYREQVRGERRIRSQVARVYAIKRKTNCIECAWRKNVGLGDGEKLRSQKQRHRKSRITLHLGAHGIRARKARKKGIRGGN